LDYSEVVVGLDYTAAAAVVAEVVLEVDNHRDPC